MFTVLYVATKSTPGLINYERSLEQFGYQYQRLGKGDKWGGWRYRMKVYQNACAARDPQELLLLTDADDMLCVKESTGFVEQYQKFGTPIVIGADCVCGDGNCIPVTNYWKTRGDPESSYVYANCGCIMGPAGALAQMWQWMYDEGSEDDQVALCHYVNKFPNQVTLDSKSQLFYLVPPQTHPEFKFEAGRLESLVDPKDHMELSPYLLHFAGCFVFPALEAMTMINPRQNHAYDQVTNKIIADGQALEYQNLNKDGRRTGIVLFWLFVSLTAFFLITTIVLTILLVKMWRKQRQPNKQVAT